MTIKDFRLSQNLSQGELAEALGISVSSERSYEYGVRKPSAKVIEKIKEVYGVDLSDEAPTAAVEEKAAEVPVEEAPVKPKRGRKKKDSAPALDEKAAETAVEDAPAKPKRGRKKKEAVPAPAVEEKAADVEKPAKRGRKKKEAAAPVDESLLQMQNNAEAAVHAVFDAKGTVIIQSPMGGEITPEEVLAKVGPVDKVYVRVDENKAYWTRGDESGAVDLW